MSNMELIVWQDTWGEDYWKMPEEVSCHPKHVYTLGWVVKETEDAIAVALDHCLEDGDYNGWSVIPKVCVISRTTLLKEEATHHSPLYVRGVLREDLLETPSATVASPAPLPHTPLPLYELGSERTPLNQLPLSYKPYPEGNLAGSAKLRIPKGGGTVDRIYTD
jgi:hypothetical protein